MLGPCLNSFFTDRVKPVPIASSCTRTFRREFPKLRVALTQDPSADTATWIPATSTKGVYISAPPPENGLQRNLTRLSSFIEVTQPELDVSSRHVVKERFVPRELSWGDTSRLPAPPPRSAVSGAPGTRPCARKEAVTKCEPPASSPATDDLLSFRRIFIVS